MDLYYVEELLKSEDLAKAVNRALINALLHNAAIARHPNSSPEDKALAEANIQQIAAGVIPKTSPAKVNQPNLSNLDVALNDVKGKISEINNNKIKQNLQNAQRVKQDVKREVADARAKKRAADREKELLPGSEHTLKELQSHINRVSPASDHRPQAEIDRENARRNTTLAQKAVTKQKKIKSVIDNALDVAHQLHAAGEADHAHKVLSSIPQEHLPKELKHYNPTYVHYNVTPNVWQKLSPEHQEHIKNFHNEVMTGVHDNSPYPNAKAMALKVRQLKPS